MLEELERLTSIRESFALESTLSGRTYIELFRKWKDLGYRIEIVFLKLDSPKLSLSRIAARVAQGGHDVPKADALRRFERGWHNFERHYRALANEFTVYDASGPAPVLLTSHP